VRETRRAQSNYPNGDLSILLQIAFKPYLILLLSLLSLSQWMKW